MTTELPAVAGLIDRLEPLLTPEDAAAYLGVKGRTLAAWRSLRTGPPFVKAGHFVRYRRADLAAWVERSTRHGQSNRA